MMPLHAKATQAEVLAFLAPGVSSFLEVGVQEGRTAELVCWSAGRLERATLCDDWGTTSGGTGRGSHDHVKARLKGLPVCPKDLRFVDGDSTLTLLKQSEPHDLVHVDGGHSYDVALSDMRHGWRLCQRDLVVHDISFPDVWRAFWEFVLQADRVDEVHCFFGGHGTAVVRRPS